MLQEGLLIRELKEQLCQETEAATEESINFANDLPPGMGKLAAMLVNRFGSLENLVHSELDSCSVVFSKHVLYPTN